MLLAALLGAGCTAGEGVGGPPAAPSPVVTAPAAATGGATPPAEADPVYLALGDSIAAGVGAPPGQGYVDVVHRSLAERHPGLQLVSLGVSGETTASMLAPGGQLERAEEALRSGDVRLVTVDIGANDGLGCALTRDESCIEVVLDEVRSNLSTVLGRLESAAPGVPVVGADYYLPVPPQLQGDRAAVADALRVLARLNGTLAEVYAAHGVPVAPVAQAFGGQDPALVVERTCALTPMCSGAPDIHPDAAGHAAIAEAVLATLPQQ